MGASDGVAEGPTEASTDGSEEGDGDGIIVGEHIGGLPSGCVSNIGLSGRHSYRQHTGQSANWNRDVPANGTPNRLAASRPVAGVAYPTSWRTLIDEMTA